MSCELCPPSRTPCRHELGVIEIDRARLQTLEAELLAAQVERDNLRKMLEDANQREQEQLHVINELRRQRDDARDARDSVLLRIAGVEDPPTPMCKVDPLEDLFPAGGGSPT